MLVNAPAVATLSTRYCPKTVRAVRRGIALVIPFVVIAPMMAACSGGSADKPGPGRDESARSDVTLHGKIHYDDEHTFGGTHPCSNYAWTVDVKNGSGTVLRVARASTARDAGSTSTGGKYCDATYSASVAAADVYEVSVEHGQGELGGDWDKIFTPVTVNANDLRSGTLPELVGTGY